MTIDNYNFAGKKAIVRVDFNVPLDENGNISAEREMSSIGDIFTIRRLAHLKMSPSIPVTSGSH